jgi:hypothetical protein
MTSFQSPNPAHYKASPYYYKNYANTLANEITDLQAKRYQKDASARWSKYEEYQTFAGPDIKAAIYLPLLTKGSLVGEDSRKFKIFADLQTISISSTRSVSPIRVFGRSSPIGYTRGARTFAGSLVFATIKKDPFNDVVDVGIGESFANATTSLVADQLPPFSIVITACTEAGAVASQIIHGITITNYGTTYSVDDLYTETTYTYVATDVMPLTAGSSYQNITKQAIRYGELGAKAAFSSLSKLVEDSMGAAYNKLVSIQQNAITARVERDLFKTVEESIQVGRAYSLRKDQQEQDLERRRQILREQGLVPDF